MCGSARHLNAERDGVNRNGTRNSKYRSEERIAGSGTGLGTCEASGLDLGLASRGMVLFGTKWTECEPEHYGFFLHLPSLDHDIPDH